MAFEVKIYDCQVSELNPKIREYFVTSRNGSTPAALAYQDVGPRQCVIIFATRSEALLAQQDLLEQFNCPTTEVVLPSYRYCICTTKSSGVDVSPALGIEVTVPALAAQCDLGNIDPQHIGSSDPRAQHSDYRGIYPEIAAIQVARGFTLPPPGAALVTVRPDLDSLGAMAVLTMALQEEPRRNDADVIERINLVAKADTFAQGEWKARALPDSDNPWPNAAGVEDTRELAAIQSICADSTLALEQRVRYVTQWLLHGEPDFSDNPLHTFVAMRSDEFSRFRLTMLDHRARVEAERKKMISAIESAEIKILWNRSLRGLGDKIPLQVCIVESTHRAATMLGYCMAPVVIAVNPRFSFNGGPEHLKYTICQWRDGYVDLDTIVARLNHLELEARQSCVPQTRWGGSKTIKGSEQGVSSLLSIEQVMHVVRDNLIEKGEN